MGHGGRDRRIRKGSQVSQGFRQLRPAGKVTPGDANQLAAPPDAQGRLHLLFEFVAAEECGGARSVLGSGERAREVARADELA